MLCLRQIFLTYSKTLVFHTVAIVILVFQVRSSVNSIRRRIRQIGESGDRRRVVSPIGILGKRGEVKLVILAAEGENGLR